MPISAINNGIRHRKIVITDAQYKTLQSSPIVLVPAWAADYAINFLRAELSARFASGAYTGASAVSSYLTIVSGSSSASNKNVSNYLANDNTASVPLSYLSTFNDATNKSISLVPASETSDVAAGWGLLAAPITAWDRSNENLYLKVVNGGSDFGGGHSSNRLIVDVWYTATPLLEAYA